MNTLDASFNSEILHSFLDVDRVRFRKTLADLLKTHSPLDALDRYIFPVFQEIGRGWTKGETSLSQVYMAGRLCDEMIPALLAERGILPRNRVPLSIAVLQDHHTLGKKIVFYALGSAGYRLIDYGSVSSPKELVQRTMADGVRVLLISTLMLPSALLIKEVTSLLKDAGGRVKIVVGGAPFNFDSELWKDVGADATSVSATESISLVAGLLKEIDHG